MPPSPRTGYRSIYLLLGVWAERLSIQLGVKTGADAKCHVHSIVVAGHWAQSISHPGRVVGLLISFASKDAKLPLSRPAHLSLPSVATQRCPPTNPHLGREAVVARVSSSTTAFTFPCVGVPVGAASVPIASLPEDPSSLCFRRVSSTNGSTCDGGRPWGGST